MKNCLHFIFSWYIKCDVDMIAPSSNGRTADSDSVNRGSNPCEAAKF